MSCSSASSAIDAAIVGTVVPRSKFPRADPVPVLRERRRGFVEDRVDLGGRVQT